MLDRLSLAERLARQQPPFPAPGAADLLPVLRLAARVAHAPLALTVGAERQAWVDPASGLGDDAVALAQALCAQIGEGPAAAVIADTRQDPKLRDDPAVVGAPHLRFVASAPLPGRGGTPLGTLCIVDTRPRPRLERAAADALLDLGTLAAQAIERRQESERLARSAHQAADRAARLDELDVAIDRAAGARAALVSLAEAACRYNGAVAAQVVQLRKGAAQVLHAWSDGSAPGEAQVRAAVPGAAIGVLRAGGPLRAQVLRARPASRELPCLALPIGLGRQRFGIVLHFGNGTPGLDGVADEITRLVRAARPALRRQAAEERVELLEHALNQVAETVAVIDAGPGEAEAVPRLLFANGAFCRAAGARAEDLVDEALPLPGGAADDPAAAERLAAKLRGGEPLEADLLQGADGGFPGRAGHLLSPVADGSGRWVAVGKAHAETDGAAFTQLLGASPVAAMLVARHDGQVLAANAAAARQLGSDGARLLASRFPALAGLETDHAGLPTTLPGAESRAAPVQAFRHAVSHRGMAGVLALLVDAQDAEQARRAARQATAALKDTAEQLRARMEELAEAQQLGKLHAWRLLVAEGHVSHSSALEELAGPALRGRLDPAELPLIRAVLRGITGGGGPASFEFRVLLPDGGERQFRGEARPVTDEGGKVVALRGWSEDVTERKHTEQVLLRNETLRTLGQLTGGVAHDFNNLLTVVILNLEEAQEILGPSHPAAEALAPALHASIRGAELTGQLLAYARRARLQPERVRPDEFFGALRPLLARLLGERHALQVLLRHNGGSAMVDPAQLDSAVMNLVINARDAMPGGGTVVLETRSVTLEAGGLEGGEEIRPGRYVVISVGDTGEGIAPELLQRVVEPFFTTKPPGKGSGLGLSMVYGFARQSGGHLKIESRLGEGTVVRLFLPVAEEEEAVAPASDDAAEWQADGLRVLLVEDQESVLRTVARMLRSLRFEVTTATSTLEASEILEREPQFDLLFTDIVLPGPMDGLALAEEVRARSPATRVLLTTGFTEHLLAAEATPGMDFLLKPYRRHDLQAKFSIIFPDHSDRFRVNW